MKGCQPQTHPQYKTTSLRRQACMQNNSELIPKQRAPRNSAALHILLNASDAWQSVNLLGCAVTVRASPALFRLRCTAHLEILEALFVVPVEVLGGERQLGLGPALHKGSAGRHRRSARLLRRLCRHIRAKHCHGLQASLPDCQAGACAVAPPHVRACGELDLVGNREWARPPSSHCATFASTLPCPKHAQTCMTIMHGRAVWKASIFVYS